MRPKLHRLAARWKLLVIPVAAMAAGLAIALPASMASTHRAADPVTARPDRVNPAMLRPAPPRAGCHVAYTATSWPGQFKARVTIDNTGPTSIRGWKLTFTFPGDERISSAWNTTFTQTDARVSLAGTDYNTTIARGESRSLGFLGTWNSDDASPTSFSVNGMACSRQVSG